MTSDDLLVPVGLGVVVLVLVVLLVMTLRALRRERARSDAELVATREEAARLRDRVEALARQMEVRPSTEEFVITGIGRDEPAAEQAAEPQRIEGRLFADLVVRETVVKAASLTHGVRRALAPATRNRIRFAMRQEVKRSRKERRIEFREVRREMAARRAAGDSLSADPTEDVA
ncbi:hypothetical protein ASG90_17485 [Nocardioides sp. Soil797]|nr:hypothetical protein ASG90_17485 [Nocardioides sp. Soil797]